MPVPSAHALIVTDAIAVCIRLAAPRTALPVSLAARPGTLIITDTVTVCIRVAGPAPPALAAHGAVVTDTVAVGVHVVGPSVFSRLDILCRCGLCALRGGVNARGSRLRSHSTKERGSCQEHRKRCD